MTEQNTQPEQPEQPVRTEQPLAPPPAPPLVPEDSTPPLTPEESAPAESPAATEVLVAEQLRRPRRKVRARWVAAVLVAVLTGGGTAAAVIAPERTELPGLETPNDGRYAFPQLALPPLPSGKPAPSASGAGNRHHADLRQLLLPAPTGVTAAADRKSCSDYAELEKEPAEARAILLENACRDAVRRVWTAADGTRTELWLLRFGSEDEAKGHYLKMNYGSLKEPAGLEASVDTIDPEMDRHSTVKASAAKAGKPGQDPQPVARAAYFQRGDVTALVLTSNQDGVPVQAFRQVAMGQYGMLG
ncbi:hypothetical protein ACIA8O_10650 [Kitasatospora sp. NPDC051853]|uniref:hypothetical protein n=1 Tax=Kitasatospora sp. NPDC051853 TaxID=3364058 RepID=UPI0037B2C6C5